MIAWWGWYVIAVGVLATLGTFAYEVYDEAASVRRQRREDERFDALVERLDRVRSEQGIE